MIIPVPSSRRRLTDGRWFRCRSQVPKPGFDMLQSWGLLKVKDHRLQVTNPWGSSRTFSECDVFDTGDCRCPVTSGPVVPNLRGYENRIPREPHVASLTSQLYQVVEGTSDHSTSTSEQARDFQQRLKNPI